MKIILSPAKKMVDKALVPAISTPVYLAKAQEILKFLQDKSLDELQKLYKCNLQIAKTNYDNLKTIDLKSNLIPALLSYSGIAYTYMAPLVFEDKNFDYLQKHLRIISALYGVLKPLDGINVYRLEMQAKASINSANDLYDYWKDDIYKEVTKDDQLIINLASEEYSKCVSKYLNENDRMITITFGELINNKIVEKGVYCKMARGTMVRYMAENNITNVDDLKNFNELSYRYHEELSTSNNFVFIKEK